MYEQDQEIEKKQSEECKKQQHDQNPMQTPGSPTPYNQQVYHHLLGLISSRNADLLMVYGEAFLKYILMSTNLHPNIQPQEF